MAVFTRFSRTDINEEAVQSYIRAGGAVSELLSDVSKGVKVYSEGYLLGGKGRRRGGAGPHVRSGRLLRGLWWNRAKLTGPLQGTAQAGSSARHTVYFHDGTAGNGAGYIMHPKMIVPINRRAAHTNPTFKGAGSQILNANRGKTSKGTKRMDRVRGQHAKPFLEEGLAASLAKQRLR